MKDDEPNDETVYRSIISLSPIINQFIRTISEVLIERDLNDVEIDGLLEYFSTLFNNYDRGSTSWSSDVTKFYGQFIITLIIAKLIKYRRFKSANSIISSKLLKKNYGGVTAEVKSIGKLNDYIKSLDARNIRLKLNRVSFHSDLINEICDISKIDHVEYMQADLVLYIAENIRNGRWWPDSLLYAADSHGAFPWFAKAVEPEFRQGLMSLIGVHDKPTLERLIESVVSGVIPPVKWQNAFSSVDVEALANFTAILASYDEP